MYYPNYPEHHLFPAVMPGASTSSATVTPTQPRKRKADQRKYFSLRAYRIETKLFS